MVLPCCTCQQRQVSNERSLDFVLPHGREGTRVAFLLLGIFAGTRFSRRDCHRHGPTSQQKDKSCIVSEEELFLSNLLLRTERVETSRSQGSAIYLIFSVL